jgi:tRNA(Ile)-lysidine synthase
MKSLIKHVQNINAQYKLWNKGDRLIVGVSGGPDSTCLLDVLVRISHKNSINLIVTHVNYGLRGDDSERDQKIVERQAQKYNVPLEIINFSNSKHSEQVFREFRYNFFVEVQKKYNADAIVIAHTKDDQAETILLNLIRGTGFVGMGGMTFKSQNGVLRPFLRVNKEDILQYCSKNDIEYGLDYTNTQNTYTRNKIRNKLIPYLKKEYNNNIVDNLANTADIIAIDYELLSECNQKIWKTDKSKNRVFFLTKDFLQLHASQQSFVLRAMINQLCGHTQNIEKGFIEEMQKAIYSTKGKNQIIFGKNLKMLRKNDTVELTCLI